MTDNEKLKKIKKLADAMYYAAQHLTTDSSRLHKTMDEYHKFIIHEWKEEPVSEELEEAMNRAAEETRLTKAKNGHPFFSEKDFNLGFSNGAQWQKEQMMASATDVTVYIEAGNYPYIPQIELYDYDKDIPLAKEGDKYKVILIKETEL